MTEPRSPAGGLDLEALRDALEDAVQAAGEAIREVIASGSVRVGMKWGEGPVTEADYAADEVLHQRLMPLIPGAHWLSEESAQSDPLVRGEPTWVVDPLDGTREFLLGIPEFGVSAALFLDDRLALGAVGLPTDGVVLSGLLDGERREARRDAEALADLVDGAEVGPVVVSRWDYERRRLHHHIPFDVYPAGSAAVKLAHVASGRADVYLATGPHSVWDIAGGAAVVEAARGTLLRANGRPLSLSPQEVRVPPFAAGAPERARALLRGIGARV